MSGADDDLESLYNPASGEFSAASTPRACAADRKVFVSEADDLDDALDIQDREEEDSASASADSVAPRAKAARAGVEDGDDLAVDLDVDLEDDLDEMDVLSIAGSRRRSSVPEPVKFSRTGSGNDGFASDENAVVDDVEESDEDSGARAPSSTGAGATSASRRSSGGSVPQSPRYGAGPPRWLTPGQDVASASSPLSSPRTDGGDGAFAAGGGKNLDAADGGRRSLNGQSSPGSATSAISATAVGDISALSGRQGNTRVETNTPESAQVDRSPPNGSTGGAAAAPTGGKAFFGNLARASATFYKSAFAKRPAAAEKRKPDTPVSASTLTTPSERTDSVAEGLPVACAKAASPAGQEYLDAKEKAHKAEAAQRRLVAMLEAQIATLNGAKAGFVDLALLRPMTERTVTTIEEQVIPMLEDFGRMELRVSELENELEDVDKKAQEELSEKESILIGAKMSLAEAQGEGLFYCLNAHLLLTSASSHVSGKPTRECDRTTLSE